MSAEAIQPARGSVISGLRISPVIKPASSRPLIAYAIDAQRLTVLQCHEGTIWFSFVAEPRSRQAGIAANTSNMGKSQPASAPAFSVHLPTRRPIRLVPSAIQTAPIDMTTSAVRSFAIGAQAGPSARRPALV